MLRELDDYGTTVAGGSRCPDDHHLRPGPSVMEWYDKALDLCNRDIELDPGQKSQDWAIASRGDTYRQMKKYDQALADFNRAIELDPGEYWAIGRRGRTYRQMRRYGKALADIKRAFKLVLSDTPPET